MKNYCLLDSLEEATELVSLLFVNGLKYTIDFIPGHKSWIKISWVGELKI